MGLVSVGEFGEEFGTAGLVVGGGVIALAEQNGLEGWVGGEVGAGLTDRLEAAVQLGGSLTPAVAEEPVVDFVLDSFHCRADGVRSDGLVGVVERFDFGCDCCVFVRDDLVGDLGVAHRHVQGSVAE